MAARKKKRPKKKATKPMTPMPVAPVVPVVVPPQPVIPKASRRFWKVIRLQNLIGGACLIAGFFFLLGWTVSDKVHALEKWGLATGLFLVVFGAHMCSSEPTENALRGIGRGISRVWRGGSANGTAEHQHPTDKP